MKKQTILTGIRANSDLTLGNFLGALLPMVRLSNEYSDRYNVNIFVPDLHSIISEVDGDLRKNSIYTIKCYLAAGLQLNENVHFYRQSRVPAHSELCWILDCIATMGETSRMIQYKEKGKDSESCSVAIFNYPILMAADILLYDAKYVPIGEDQFQHIELARNLALRFNHKFGEIFTVPEKTEEQIKFMHEDRAIRIRDLVNPDKKMSKSSQSENSKIMLSDSPLAATKKIMSATTDSLGRISFDMINQPGISNLLIIESMLSNRSLSDVVSEWSGETRYGDLKKKVASSVSSFLETFKENLSSISSEDVEELLETGEAYANEVSEKKLKEVQKLVGLR